jgi:23S rRNA (uracil1939-C5)-methyltransferase
VLAGFREREKPYIADLQRCEILIERFATLPAELAALIGMLSVREQVPQVEVAAGDERAALTFRVMQTPDAEDLRKLEAFAARLGVDVYLQRGGLDTIRPLNDQPGKGPDPLVYAVDGGRIRLEFGPSDFIQINREVNLAMVEAAIGHLGPGPGDSVLDLFCGLGNFTLPLARRAARTVGVEGDPLLVAKARANASANGIEAEFFVGNLFEAQGFGSWADETYDLVLLDPPRAGALEIVERMPQWGPRRVVYISCHPGSLARDTGVLAARGFKLTGAGVMDMFPHTTHVESIAVFERAS